MEKILKKWGDFAEPHEGPLPGKKIQQNEYLNKEIIVTQFKIMPSKKREDSECLCLQVKIDEDFRIIFSGSGVLMKQCQKYAEHMPFLCRIVKIDRYLTFAD